MENFGEFTAGYYDVKDQLPHYIRRKAEEMIALEEKEKSRIKTVKVFEKRRERLKKIFIESIGGLPEVKTPLKPVITGKIEKKKYLIEKVIFESQPKHYVTSNLYLPKKINNKAPAVLFVCGHALEAKSAPIYQKVCIDLVENGFVVLAIDPPGQGERMQYYNNIKKTTDVRWGTVEHSYAGFQCILSGAGIARYFIWDGMRGIDYLLSRPEVDGERIGVTGNSGGGTQTAYLTFLDERIKCSMPCSYITSRIDYMKTGQAHDAEQNVFGIIKNGINYDDFVTGIAPRPVQIGANAFDFFCIEGTLRTFEKAKKVYSLYGEEKKIRMVVSNTTHQYSDVLRQAAVNWFKLHLKKEKQGFITGAKIITLKPEDLNCTQSGQVLAEFTDSETVYSLNEKYTKEIFPKRTVVAAGKALDKYIAKTSEKLAGVLSYEKSTEKIYPRVIETEFIKELNCERESLFFFSEKDITVTGYLFKPCGAKVKLKSYILSTEKGTLGYTEQKTLIKKLVKKGYAVFLPDVRGIGAVSSREVTASSKQPGIYDSEFKYNYDAMMLGTSIAGLRVFDIVRAFDYLESRTDLDKNNINLIGSRAAGIWALFAGVLQKKIKRVILSGAIYSFKEITSRRLFTYNNKILLHGILKNLDIVDLLPCFQGREILLLKPIDAGGKPARKEILDREVIDLLKVHYGAAASQKKPIVLPGTDLLNYKGF